MNIEKIRNLGPDEMLHQQREAADQLFRLKFQLKMGQTTGLKKMRELRKDLARIKTIARERELGITTAVVSNATTGTATAAAQEAAPRKTAAPKQALPRAAAHPAKKAAGKKKKASAAPKKSAAKKKGKAKK
jgi:large subunit ribosomal protein L29